MLLSHVSLILYCLCMLVSCLCGRISDDGCLIGLPLLQGGWAVHPAYLLGWELLPLDCVLLLQEPLLSWFVVVGADGVVAAV